MSEQFFGNYRVLQKIGAGGMAKVYLGAHRDVANLRVVLKVLTDARLIERFRQEADKLALLDGHPNVCQIKDFFSHGDDAVIAMEYIDGRSLEDLLEEQDPLPVNEALRLMTDVVGVLEFAHQRGIYHRDIKPSNIMVDKSGQVKIIDFGIAKAETDPHLTSAGAMCGTPAYMAPEQFTGTEKTNYALVDIYAVGTTLFRLTTGEMPFKGENEFVLRDAKLFNDPPSPRKLNGTIKPALEKVILQTLDKDPDRRPQSMTELRHALLKVRGDEGKQSTATHAPTVATIAKPPKKSSPLPKILGVLAVVAILAVAGWYFLFPGGEEADSGPRPPELVSPANGAIVTDTRQPELVWSAPGAQALSYELQYDRDSLFSDPMLEIGLRGLSCQLDEELTNGTYYWRVYPVNDEGALGKPSEKSSFTIEVQSDTAVVPETVPRGQLQVTVNPRGDIYLEGNRVARNDESFVTTLDTGSYELRVENSRSVERVFSEAVQVRDGGTVTRAFSFTFPPEPPAQMYGEARVGSKPKGADVYIDGELQAQQTNYQFRLTAGTHVIRTKILWDGQELEQTDTVEIKADSIHRIMFDFEH